MSLETTIFQILKAIDVAFENQDFNYETTLDLKKLKISKHRLELFIEELIDKNYIKGIVVKHSINGNPIILISNPRLTLDGLDFLENTSSMKKAYKFLKEAKEWIPGL